MKFPAEGGYPYQGAQGHLPLGAIPHREGQGLCAGWAPGREAGGFKVLWGLRVQADGGLFCTARPFVPNGGLRQVCVGGL